MRLDEIELERWGERIGSTIRPPAFICLEGQLGAGKSALARAIGRGAGVEVAMPSPSYNLLLRYPASSSREVVHIDLYRLESPDDLWELGWSQLGSESEIVLVEWADRAEGALPSDRVARFLGQAEIIPMPTRRDDPSSSVKSAPSPSMPVIRASNRSPPTSRTSFPALVELATDVSSANPNTKRSK